MSFEFSERALALINMGLPHMGEEQMSQLLPVAVAQMAITCASIASGEALEPIGDRLVRLQDAGTKFVDSKDFYEKVLTDSRELRFVEDLTIVFSAVALYAHQEAYSESRGVLKAVRQRY